MERTETALIIFGLTALLGVIAAFAGITAAVFGGYKAGTLLCAAAAGWWLEALIAGRDIK